MLVFFVVLGARVKTKAANSHAGCALGGNLAFPSFIERLLGLALKDALEAKPRSAKELSWYGAFTKPGSRMASWECKRLANIGDIPGVVSAFDPW